MAQMGGKDSRIQMDNSAGSGMKERAEVHAFCSIRDDGQRLRGMLAPKS